MKKITLLLLSLLCGFVGYSQFPENFEAVTVSVPNVFPAGWLVTDNGVGTVNNWEINNNPSVVVSGVKSAYIDSEAIGMGNTSEDWLISPMVTIPANGQLKFKAKQSLTGDNGTIFQIRISSGATQSDLTSYTVLKQWTENEMNQVFNITEEKIVDFPAAMSGATLYIAFVRVYTQPIDGTGGDRWIIDDIDVVQKCLVPMSINVTNISATSAVFFWTGSVNSQGYELEIMATNFSPTGVPNFISTSNIYTITGLTPNTCYTFYVRTSCGNGNFSQWGGPFNFCTLNICTMPLAQNVSNITTNSATLTWTPGANETQWEALLLQAPNAIVPSMPQAVPTVGPFDFYIQNLNSSTTTLNNLHPSTIYYFYVRAVCQSDDTMSSWAGPFIFNTDTCNVQDKCTYQFYLTNEGFNTWNGGIMQVRQNGVVVATLGADGINNQNGIAVSICNAIPFDLFWSQSGTQPELMGIRVENSFGDTVYTKVAGEGTPLTVLYSDITLDNCLPATCIKPQNLTVNVLTPTSVSLSWSEQGSATQWEVYITEFGNPAPINGTPLNINNAAYTISNTNSNFVISNLNEAANYQYYVRAICSSSDLSTWNTIANTSIHLFKLVAFIDHNSNGIKDAGESNFNYGNYTFEKNNNGILHHIGSSYGIAEIYNPVITNTYDFNFEIDSEFQSYYAMVPTNFNDIGTTVGLNTQTFYFPITVTQPYNDVQVSITALDSPRPGFPFTHKIIYKNAGHNPSTGTINYLKDNANVTITSTFPSATTTTSNGFSINYTNLLPGEMETILVHMLVATIPTINLGDILTHSVSITSSETETNYTNNTFSSVQTVVGSYDPNDKTEARGSNVQIGQFTQNDYLFYTIRFQNSGTASAETVRIEDALESEFDFASIRMVSASHNYTMQRVNNKIIWTFDYINLPSEMADEPGSHGYVTFKIKLNPGFAVNDVIENTAKIYFDFNPAIVTNTFQTTFIPNLNTVAFGANNVMVYPNPAKEIVSISLQNATEHMQKIVIYDMVGKSIKTISANNAQEVSIPIHDVSTGVYLIEITTVNNLKQIRKLIVK